MGFIMHIGIPSSASLNYSSRSCRYIWGPQQKVFYSLQKFQKISLYDIKLVKKSSVKHVSLLSFIQIHRKPSAVSVLKCQTRLNYFYLTFPFDGLAFSRWVSPRWSRGIPKNLTWTNQNSEILEQHLEI